MEKQTIDRVDFYPASEVEDALMEMAEHNQATLFRMKSVYDKDCKEFRAQITILSEFKRAVERDRCYECPYLNNAQKEYELEAQDAPKP